MTERLVASKIDADHKLANAAIETAKTSLNMALGLNIMAFITSVVFFAVRNQVAGIAFTSFTMIMLIRSFPRARPMKNLPITSVSDYPGSGQLNSD